MWLYAICAKSLSESEMWSNKCLWTAALHKELHTFHFSDCVPSAHELILDLSYYIHTCVIFSVICFQYQQFAVYIIDIECHWHSCCKL